MKLFLLMLLLQSSPLNLLTDNNWYIEKAYAWKEAVRKYLRVLGLLEVSTSDPMVGWEKNLKCVKLHKQAKACLSLTMKESAIKMTLNKHESAIP